MRMPVKNSERECATPSSDFFFFFFFLKGFLGLIHHTLWPFQRKPFPHTYTHIYNSTISPHASYWNRWYFGLCCDFPPLEAETTLPVFTTRPLYSTNFAEWFYDFMLHFGHFVDIFNFRSAKARAFTLKYSLYIYIYHTPLKNFI